MRAFRQMRVRVFLGMVAAVALPAVASAQPAITAPKLGDFRSVLAQGEGQQLNALEFGAYQASGNPPPSYTSQQPLYVDIMPRVTQLTEADLDRYYKNSEFGEMPGGVGAQYSPRPGATVFRDATYNMAHIYGETRSDVMFAVGYATAEERLFAMDILRHASKGTLAELIGPSGAEMDREQLTDQNFTDDELREQFNALPEKFGPAGARGRQDVLDYIAGINARINDVKTNPTILPAEYPALGVQPEEWDVSDTVAMAVLLVTQFTVSNGGEEQNAQMRLEFKKRFGKRWRAKFNDFRTADDPETYTVAAKRHLSDRPGKRRKNVNLIPDLGSIKPFNPQTTGPGAAEASSVAPWVKTVARARAALPEHASNGVAVGTRYSKTGKPLWAAGPQVDYWSPQIFVEYELHGGGLDASGVSFPGASPWPLIGHGIDFAWSGTSANGDNEDTFVETLCEPDGSEPTKGSRHYRYRGKCIPFMERDIKVTTPPPSAGNQNPPEEIVYHPLRSVHGPVFAFATVKGKPVALAKAKGVNFRELDAVLPFMHIAENEPTDYKSFVKTFSPFPGTENWFYVDDRRTGFMQSGSYPAHARGADVDLPYNGDGTGDWQGFDPEDYTYKRIALSRRPKAVDTEQPIIISWNQKEAPGWRKGPTEWSDGSVHRAEILETYVKAEIRKGGGKTDLTGLMRAVNRAAITDVRGQHVYGLMRRVVGKARGGDEQMLKLIDKWRRDGSHRLDEDGDNLYENGAAVALFDNWWPMFVRASFRPALGEELFAKVTDFIGIDGNGWDWASHVDKDLRMVLGRKVRGPHSQIYCGGAKPRGARKRCRNVLLKTLRVAVEQTSKEQASDDPAAWKVQAICDEGCDNIEPTELGAVGTPPFPWQNRGTFHQVVEMSGHR